jgi:glycosyltransferase involved in cell wall biosynthesis
MKKTLLIIPAYNEEENIASVIEKLRENHLEELADILVINDGSKDNTEKVVRAQGVKVISQIYNMGYGAALQVAYKYAVEKQYENFPFRWDAEGQHDVENVRYMYELLTHSKEEELPIVIGSRFLEGAVRYPMSAIRILAIKMFRGIISIVTKQKITDPTSGLQGLNRSAFGYYAGYLNFDTRYPDINMIIQMSLRGYKIKEFPAIMHIRQQGIAMHSGIITDKIVVLCF